MWRALLHVFLLTLLSGCVSAISKQKAKKSTQIKWNSSYYSSAFHPCKPLRILNAVEKIKAQKAAVEAFRQCGSKLLSLAAFKYQFPSFAMAASLKYFCLLYNAAFAYIADDGGLIISPKTESARLRELATRFAGVLATAGNVPIIRHGKGIYRIPPGLIEEGVPHFFRCTLPNKLTSWVDGDMAKFSVSHHESMLF